MAETASGVRAAIEHDRADLADTVQALVQKADVTDRVRESVADATGQLQEKGAEVREHVREATPDGAQRAFHVALEKIQMHPVATALTVVFLLGIVVGRRGAHHTSA